MKSFVVVFSVAVVLVPISLRAQNVSSLSETVDLHLPSVVEGMPKAGKRVAVTPPEYTGTDVHHMIYLPEDWTADSSHKYPMIVEYSGNQFSESGSTGKVEDSALGFGISRGRFIWVNLPFVSENRQENAVRWWGDEAATIDYAITNVRRICEQYHGDSNLVFLCGFSRGAIATNYIGLHNDEIAKLWCAFITHDHFDGVKAWGKTTWGSPLSHYRKESAKRLGRLNGRPYLVCQNGGTRITSDYLRSTNAISMGSFTFVDVATKRILGEFPNEVSIHPHTDRWLLKESKTRQKVWDWVSAVVENSGRPE